MYKYIICIMLAIGIIGSASLTYAQGARGAVIVTIPADAQPILGRDTGAFAWTSTERPSYRSGGTGYVSPPEAPKPPIYMDYKAEFRAYNESLNGKRIALASVKKEKFQGKGGVECKPMYRITVRIVTHKETIYADSITNSNGTLNYTDVVQNQCMMNSNYGLRIPYNSIVYIEKMR